MPKLDLSKVAGNEVRVLIGHDRGRAVRELFDLDGLDTAQERVIIVVPESVRTLTPSFVQGLVADSVYKLGESGFFEHYCFEGSSNIQNDIRAGVDRVLTSRQLAGAA